MTSYLYFEISFSELEPAHTFRTLEYSSTWKHPKNLQPLHLKAAKIQPLGFSYEIGKNSMLFSSRSTDSKPTSSHNAFKPRKISDEQMLRNHLFFYLFKSFQNRYFLFFGITIPADYFMGKSSHPRHTRSPYVVEHIPTQGDLIFSLFQTI